MALSCLPSLRHSALQSAPGDFHHTRHYPAIKRDRKLRLLQLRHHKLLSVSLKQKHELLDLHRHRRISESLKQAFENNRLLYEAEMLADAWAILNRAHKRATMSWLNVMRDVHAASLQEIIVNAHTGTDYDDDTEEFHGPQHDLHDDESEDDALVDADDTDNLPAEDETLRIRLEQKREPENLHDDLDDGDSTPISAVVATAEDIAAGIKEIVGTEVFKKLLLADVPSAHPSSPAGLHNPYLSFIESTGKLPHRVPGSNMRCAVYSIALALADSEQQWTCQFDREVTAHNILDQLTALIESDTWPAIAETAAAERAGVSEYSQAKDLEIYQEAPFHGNKNLSGPQVSILISLYQQVIAKTTQYCIVMAVSAFDSPPHAAYSLMSFTRDHDRFDDRIECFRSGKQPSPDVDDDVEHKTLIFRHYETSDLEGHYEPYLRVIDPAEVSHHGHVLDLTPEVLALRPLYNGGSRPEGHVCSNKPCASDDVRARYCENVEKTIKLTTELAAKLEEDSLTDRDPAETRKATELAAAEALASHKAATFLGVTFAKPPRDAIPIPTAEQVRKGTRTQYGEIELVILDGAATKTDAYNNVRTLRGSMGFILMEKHNNAPFPAREKPEEERGQENLVDMTISLESPASAPGIKISFSIRRGRSVGRATETTHSGSVVFYFSQLFNHRVNSRYRGILPGTLKAVFDPESLCIDLEFKSEGAVANNLQPPADMNLQLEERQMLALLKAFVNVDNARTVKLRMMPFSKAAEQHKEALLSSPATKPQDVVVLERWGAFDAPAQRYDPVNRAAFSNYKRTNQSKGNLTKVKIAFNAEKSRYAIITAVPHTPLVSMPVYANFVDCVHGELALGYGSIYEHKELKRHLLSLQQNEHTCAILRVGEVALITVKFTLTPSMGYSQDEKFSLPPNTVVDLAIATGREDSASEVKGRTIDNTLGLPHADIVVLVTGSGVKKIRLDGNWFAKHGLRPGKRHMCRVTAEINESVVKAQVDAVSKAWDPEREGGRGTDLLDVLMFDGVRSCPVIKPFERLRKPQAAVTHLDTAMPWNESQRAVIDGSKSLSGGYQLITGCAGTGKTAILTEKATAFAKGGAYVLLASDRNTVVDNLADSLKRSKHTAKFSVVRAYAAIQSLGEIVRERNPAAPSDDSTRAAADLDLEAEKSVFDILSHKIEERKLKSRGRPEYAVESHIMAYIEKKVPNFTNFTQGTDLNGDPKIHPDYPDEVDMFNFFNEFLTEVKAHPLHEQVDPDATRIHLRKPDTPKPESSDKVKYWDDGALDLVKQCMAFNREYVIRNADILLTTVSNCGSEEVRKNFAPNTERVVAVEIDEALTITEPSVLIPLTKLTASSRIISTCQYGDVKQLGPVVLGVMGSFNADWPGLNEFGAQLRTSQMARLIKAGFYCYKLNEQARMAPEVFHPANIMFYDGEIKTTTANKDYSLPDGYDEILRNAAGYESDSVLTIDQQRLLWLKLPGDSMRVAPSGSKGNHATLWKTIKIAQQFSTLFADKTSLKVAIITPYARQRDMYFASIAAMQQQTKKPRSHFPRIMTVDSSIGIECEIGLVDLVIHSLEPRETGFLKAIERCCVMFTRSRLAMWLVSGDKFEDRYAHFESDFAPSPSAGGAGSWDADDNPEQDDFGTNKSGGDGSWEPDEAANPDPFSSSISDVKEVKEIKKVKKSTWAGESDGDDDDPVFKVDKTDKKSKNKKVKFDDLGAAKNQTPLDFYLSYLSRSDCVVKCDPDDTMDFLDAPRDLWDSRELDALPEVAKESRDAFEQARKDDPNTKMSYLDASDITSAIKLTYDQKQRILDIVKQNMGADFAESNNHNFDDGPSDDAGDPAHGANEDTGW